MITAASLLAIAVGNNSVLAAYTYFAGKQRFAKPKIGGMVMWTSLLPVILLQSLLYLLPAWLLERVVPAVSVAELWLVVLWTLQLLLNGQVAGILAGIDEIRWIVLLSVASSLLELLLHVIFLIVLNMGLTGAFRLLFLSATIKSGLALLLLHFRVGINIWPGRDLIRETFAFSSKYYPGSVSKVMMVRADLYVVGLLVGPAAAGYYAVARGVATMLSVIERPIRQAVLPKVVASEFDRSAKLVNRAFRSGFWLTALVAALAAALSPWLIPAVYGADFTNSVPVFILLLPGMLLLVTLTIEPFFSMQLGRPEITTAIVVLAALFSVPAIYIFTRQFGYLGTAVASSLGTSVRAVAIILIYLRITNQSMQGFFLPQPGELSQIFTTLKNAARRFLVAHGLLSG